MLEIFNRLSSETSNIIIYSNSPILQAVIKDTIKASLQIERNHSISVYTSSEYKDTKEQTMIPPFGGGLWLVDVNTEKITLKEIKKHIKEVSNSSVTVYWTESYAMYKKLIELEEVKNQGVYCKSFYFGRLETEDIDYLHTRIVPDDNKLTKELLNYVKKNYTYDVQNVCTLFMKLKSGETVKTTKDIINMIGIGGNTIDSFIMKLLATNPKTEQGLKTSFVKILQLLTDLNYTYSYSEIKRFMLYSIDGIVDMKQLQIMGKYSRVRKDIPDTYPEKFVRRLNRLKRFEGRILEQVNLARVLNLKMCLEAYNDFDNQVALIQGILQYLIAIKKSNELNPESKEIKVSYRRRS